MPGRDQVLVGLVCGFRIVSGVIVMINVYGLIVCRRNFHGTLGVEEGVVVVIIQPG